MGTDLTDAELISLVKGLIPRMTSSHYKGQCGRVGIIGGCTDYPGAAFFAGMAALKVGSDLSHVFCTIEAGPIIKAYSPELIVHPMLDKTDAMEEMLPWLPRLQALVVGPGLGYNDIALETAKIIIGKARERDMPVVVDAHAFMPLVKTTEVVQSYRKAILTPNNTEFKALYKSVLKETITHVTSHDVETLATRLGGVTIASKGEVDIISNGACTVFCQAEGSVRRVWGQGDLLAGVLGPFLHWAIASSTGSSTEDSHKVDPVVLAGYAACLLTRECNKLAYDAHHRATTTSDMIRYIGPVFCRHFEVT